MGSGGSKSHESFAVAPGAAVTPQQTPTAISPQVPPAVLAALDQLSATAAHPSADPAVTYQQLAGSCAAAQAAVEAASTDPLVTESVNKDIKSATASWLITQPAEVLIELAAAAGFAHPHLVGLSGSTGPHPLAHYLDPAYPPDSPSKAAIAAKAEERYATLAAGGTVAGLTLAQLHDLEQTLPPSTPADPTAGVAPAVGPAQALQLSAAVTKAATAAGGYYGGAQHNSALVADLLVAENALASATCPEAPEAMLLAQAAARAQVQAVLTKLGTAAARAALSEPAVQALLPPDSRYLPVAEQLQLARANLDPAIREALTTKAAGRVQDIAAAQQATAALIASKTHLLAVPAGPLNPDAVVGFAQAAGTARTAAATVAAFRAQTYDPATGALPADLLNDSTNPGLPHALTGEFTTWSKQHKLAELRTVATSLGLLQAHAANRAQITKYIAGQWDPALQPTAVQAAVSSKITAAAAKASTAKPAAAATASPPPVTAGAAATGPKPASTAGPPTAGTSPTTAATGMSAPPSAMAWMAQHQRLVDALKHHQASAGALPARHDPAAVAGWTFTASGPATGLGGVHSKTFTIGPDGNTWLFKPDTSAGGARAHAEAAAAAVYHAVGIPAVDVHVATVGGKAGSVQPLLPGVSQLPTTPKSWTQGDVDAMVRYHVAAWAVGDHDGGPANVLRTSDGGLVPCDGGQAFKFWGRDKLSSDYAPNSGHGAPKAVFHLAYAAAAAGDLAPGVTIRPEAAAGVLAAFEQIPDSQYRAMLHATAHQGAQHGVHWVEPLRKAAAKTLGIPADQVTTGQIADQFLATAVARKANLRAAFVEFFTDSGYAASAAKLKGLQ